MRKNDSYYTFLLTHTTKEKIFIRRVEVSKKVLHSATASAFLLFALTSISVFAVARTDAASTIAQLFDEQSVAATSSIAADTEQAPKPVREVQKPIDYSRPVPANSLEENRGGPNSGSFQLTAVDSEDEETTIEKKLRLIESQTNPRFLPTIWAHLGKINNEFGYRRNPFGGRSYEFHSGMDIDGEKGDMIVAPANGVVLTAGWKGGYGKFIELDHGNGLTTRYGHLSKLDVSQGDRVQRGQLIGLVGSTGRSTGPHLHYELRLDKKAINPRRFLPPEQTQ